MLLKYYIASYVARMWPDSIDIVITTPNTYHLHIQLLVANYYMHK